MTSTITSGGHAETTFVPAPEPAAARVVPGPGDALPEPETASLGLRRFSALDGLRAFAVLAVMLFHFGVPWIGGGLLGVDVFFVLSGFLITTLLCRELTRTSTIRLGRFWAQRARRLVPALLVLLLGVAAYAYAFRNSINVQGVRNDAVSTLLYVANWHFIVSNQGYFFQAAAPPPLLHTWSLAVEEQYYLIWPVVALLVFRRWGRRALAVTAGVGALASAGLMLSMLLAGFSPDRLYYGTDTRAQALLIGSFLGAVGSHAGDHFSIVPSRWTRIRHSRYLWSLPGVLGAAFLLWAWHVLDGQNGFLYRGGFLLVAIAAGAIIVTCVTVPTSAMPRFLSLGALVFIGRISYGLYLYHWPLFLVINHAHTGLLGFPLLASRLAATFAAATASWYLIEEPIRTGVAFKGRRGVAVTGAVATLVVGAVLAATVAAASSSAAVPVSGTGPVFAVGHGKLPRVVPTGAVATGPTNFLLLGDSVALTTGLGLGVDSQSQYNVDLWDEGALGCDLDDVDVLQSGTVTPATPGCPDWRTQWPTEVSFFQPTVVGLLIGRWEVTDHFYDGKWYHVGETFWDDHLAAELNQAVDIFTAHRAKVVLFTMPYVDPSQEAADGQPFTENDPTRMDAFNRILRQVAKERSSVVTLVDLNKLLDPDGHFQAVIDGVTVRTTDGIHITEPGGEWLRPHILPTIASLGCSARQAAAGTSASKASAAGATQSNQTVLGASLCLS